MKIYKELNEKEIWKLIPNSKSYFISNFGRVKRGQHKVWNKNNNSWSTIKEKILSPSDNNSKGYLRISIYYKNGKRVTESIHRLVAAAFKLNPNIEKFNQVNHLDGNIKNNYWRNLQWCTNQMNMDHSWKLGNRKSGGEAIIGITSRKLTEETVKRLPELLKTKTMTEISKELGVGVTTISEIKHGRTWSWLNLKFS